MASNKEQTDDDVASQMAQIYSQLQPRPRFQDSSATNSVSEPRPFSHPICDQLNNILKDADQAEKENSYVFICNLRQRLKEKESELEQVKGRLKEARRLREMDLDQSQKTRKDYEEIIAKLEHCVQESHDKLKELEGLKTQRKAALNEINTLKAELDKSRMETQSKLEVIRMKEKDIQNLEAANMQLESFLEHEKELQKTESETCAVAIDQSKQQSETQSYSEEEANKTVEETRNQCRDREELLIVLNRATEQLKQARFEVQTLKQTEDAKITSLRDANCKLTAENEIFREFHHKLQSDLQQTIEQCEVLNGKVMVLEGLHHQVEQLETYREQLVHQLNLKSSEVLSLKESTAAETAELCSANLLLNSDNKLLRELNHKLVLDLKKSQETCEALHDQVNVMEAAHSKKVGSLDLDLTRAQTNCEMLSTYNSELEAEINQLRASNQEVTNENEKLKLEVEEITTLKQLLTLKEETIQGKTAELEESKRKLLGLQHNKSTLMETLTALSAEQAKLVKGVEEKDAECDRLTNVNAKLAEEKEELFRELQKTKCDLNEVKSLKIYSEKMLQSVETSLRKENESMEAELKLTKENLETARQTNEDLFEQSNSALKKINELETDSILIKKQYDDIAEEKERLVTQQTVYSNSYVDLKSKYDELKEAFGITLDKGEEYREMFYQTRQELNDLKLEMKAQEESLRGTMSQQEKAMNALLDKIDWLEKKKKGTFSPMIKVASIFTGRSKNAPPPSPVCSTRELPAASSTTSVVPMDAVQVSDTKMDDRPPAILDTSLESSENISGNVGWSIKANQIVSLKPLSGQVVFHSINYINSLDVFLLGRDTGLYSIKPGSNDPVKIEGPSAIYSVAILEPVNLAVLIEGHHRSLTTVAFSLLKTCAKAAECSKPSFQSNVIENVKNCYKLAYRFNQYDDVIVCVLTKDTILLCKVFNGDLIIESTIKVQDCIASMLLTCDSLIYCSTDVFALDFKTLNHNLFLDGRNKSVSQVKKNNEGVINPLAFLDISEGSSIRGRKEYLVCLEDIGLFVDKHGRRSRDGDILWSCIPTAFEYRHPFLYILSRSSLEVQNITETSYMKKTHLKDKVESFIIKPESRCFKIDSEYGLTCIGEGAVGMCVAFDVEREFKVMELSPEKVSDESSSIQSSDAWSISS